MCVSLLAVAAQAQQVEESQLGEAVERHLSSDEAITQWAQDPQLLDAQAGDKLEVREVAAEQVETVKLQNVIPPIRFESGVAQIPREYVDRLGRLLGQLEGRENWRRSALKV